MKKMFSRAVCLLLCTCMLCTGVSAYTIIPVDKSSAFSDELIEKEKVSSWAKSEVDAAWKAGLITEHTGDYVTKDISRFQFAELIVNMTEKVTGKTITPAAADTFDDCREEAVRKAYAVGIVNGKSATTFAPDENCTREQIAAMIHRAWKYIGQETGCAVPTDTKAFNTYVDKSKVSPYAVEAVGVLATCGVMKGTSATELSPKNSCTVEMCILLIYRLYQRF